MNFPPMVMRIIIDRRDRGINLWLPLFIIAPFTFIILFAIFLLLLPLILIGAIVMWIIGLRWPIRMFFKAIGVSTAIMFALRGLKVDVNSGTERVFISFS